MKTAKYLLALSMAAVMAACSSDDPAPQTVPADAQGNAYLKVLITSASSSGRADDGGYVKGVNESDVDRADFFFYDEDGVFVAQANIAQASDQTEDNFGWTSSTKNGVELNSSTVIVLKGVTELNFPKYMVTVLNLEKGFAVPQTLTEMEACLSALRNSVNGYFVMSTSSYAGSGSPYFANEIQAGDFCDDPDTAKQLTPIEIYVERLASKVEVTISDKTHADADDYIPLKVTVAGKDNGLLEGSLDDTNVSAEQVYVKLGNWSVNTVAKTSYLMKNLNNSNFIADPTVWDFSTKANYTGFEWNSSDDHRSFWGKSCTYNQKGTNTTADTNYNYITYGDLVTKDKGLDYNESTYIPENTQPSAILTSNFGESVTSVVLRAQLFDSEKKNPIDGILYKGVLFTPQRYIEYELASLKTKGNLNFYTRATDGKFNRVAPDDVICIINATGYTKLKVRNGVTVYEIPSFDATATPLDSNGNAIDFTDTDKVAALATTSKAKLNGYFSDFNGTANQATYYEGGHMYYVIPIQHLVNPLDADGNYDATAKEEGQYGVVRNHIYQISVNSITKLGYGAYSPDTMEKFWPSDPTKTPDPNDPDNPSDPDDTNNPNVPNTPIDPGDPSEGNAYQVGVNINILEWKVVSSGVNL